MMPLGAAAGGPQSATPANGVGRIATRSDSKTSLAQKLAHPLGAEPRGRKLAVRAVAAAGDAFLSQGLVHRGPSQVSFDHAHAHVAAKNRLAVASFPLRLRRLKIGQNRLSCNRSLPDADQSDFSGNAHAGGEVD